MNDWWRQHYCDPCWRGDHDRCEAATVWCECWTCLRNDYEQEPPP